MGPGDPAPPSEAALVPRPVGRERGFRWHASDSFFIAFRRFIFVARVAQALRKIPGDCTSRETSSGAGPIISIRRDPSTLDPDLPITPHPSEDLSLGIARSRRPGRAQIPRRPGLKKSSSVPWGLPSIKSARSNCDPPFDDVNPLSLDSFTLL